MPAVGVCNHKQRRFCRKDRSQPVVTAASQKFGSETSSLEKSSSAKAQFGKSPVQEKAGSAKVQFRKGRFSER